MTLFLIMGDERLTGNLVRKWQISYSTFFKELTAEFHQTNSYRQPTILSLPEGTDPDY